MTGRPDWHDYAACGPQHMHLFYPSHTGNQAATEAAAKALCASCPVQADCLEWALVHDEDGLWGGHTPAERDVILHERNKLTRRSHGTRAAYKRHINHGDPPCEACREANRRHQAEHRAKHHVA